MSEGEHQTRHNFYARYQPVILIPDQQLAYQYLGLAHCDLLLQWSDLAGAPFDLPGASHQMLVGSLPHELGVDQYKVNLVHQQWQRQCALSKFSPLMSFPF